MLRRIATALTKAVMVPQMAQRTEKLHQPRRSSRQSNRRRRHRKINPRGAEEPHHPTPTVVDPARHPLTAARRRDHSHQALRGPALALATHRRADSQRTTPPNLTPHPTHPVPALHLGVAMTATPRPVGVNAGVVGAVAVRGRALGSP